VRGAHTDKYMTSTSTSNQQYPKVDIHDLREAERSFHLIQDIVDQQYPVRQQRRYATGVRRILPESRRRTTERFRNQHRASHSRPR